MSAPFPVQRAEPSVLPEVGEVVAGRYTIERFIARGGMSHVFAARHSALDSVLALKVLDPKLFQGVQDAKLRFTREAKLASRLRHPSIVEVFDIGVTESGLPFIAMELLDGQSLSKLMREQAPLTWPRARAFILQILDALQVAHAAGAVHRDVKPDNCLVLRGTEHLKLLDFGIARVEDQTQVTVAGRVMGTPHYLSPEQARGATTDARSDVYSAGIVLYEMLSGHCPFEAGTTFEIVGAHITEPPPPLSSLIDVEPLPEGLPELIERTLAKDPDFRPPNAGSFAEEIRALDRASAPGGVAPSVWIGAAAAAFVIGLGAVGIASLISDDPAVMEPAFGAVAVEPAMVVAAPHEAESEAAAATPAMVPETPLAEPYVPEDEASPVPSVEVEKERPEDATTPEPPVDVAPEEEPGAKPRGKKSNRKRQVSRTIRKAVASCAKFAPPGGAQVSLRVVVSGDGALRGSQVRPPYAGSVLGRCVARALGDVDVGSGGSLSFDQRVRVGG